MVKQHLTDEQLIDYVLDKLSDHEAKLVSRHLYSCERCQTEWLSWQSLLADENVPKQSIHLERQLQQDLDRYQQKQKLKRKIQQSKKLYVAILTAVVCVFSYLLYLDIRDAAPSNEYTKAELTPVETRNYEIMPVKNPTLFSEIETGVWYDPLTNQIYVGINQFNPLLSESLRLRFDGACFSKEEEILYIRDQGGKVFYLRVAEDKPNGLKLYVKPKKRTTELDSFLIDLNAE